MPVQAESPLGAPRAGKARHSPTRRAAARITARNRKVIEVSSPLRASRKGVLDASGQRAGPVFCLPDQTASDWRCTRRAPVLMGFASLNPSCASAAARSVGWVERSETHQPRDIPVTLKLL